MKIVNTSTQTEKVPVFMLLYGLGGIGKSTFATTAPGAFMADCENGSKYFGLRGIHLPVAIIETWFDFAGEDQFVDIAIKNDKVQTIIVDPIGELMEKCKRGLSGPGLTDSNGNPSLKGWGEIGNRMRTQLRKLRDSGKNVIIIAHVEKVQDEGRVLLQPKIQTKLSDDIVNMVDIVAYMHAQQQDDGTVSRIITVDPSNDKVTAKDRTDRLPKILKPNFMDIFEAINPEGEKGDSKSGLENTDAPKSPEGVADKPSEVEEAKKKTLEAARAKLKSANKKA